MFRIQKLFIHTGQASSCVIDELVCLYCQHTAECGAIRAALPDWQTSDFHCSAPLAPPLPGSVWLCVAVENEEDKGIERQMQMEREVKGAR